MWFKKEKESEKHGKRSYAQSGEDCIAAFIFELLRIQSPVYLDIGAHHPYYLSNTAFFYLSGCKGVSVEPDPELFKMFRQERPLETTLQAGITDVPGQAADFYVMDVPTLNTFSKAEADRYVSYGKKVSKVLSIPLLTSGEVIKKHMDDKCPNFVSIDIEGMDLRIVKAFDFQKYRPEVFCIETLSYTEDNSEQKQQELIDFMVAQGYMIYADTYINTIFVDSRKWKKR